MSILEIIFPDFRNRASRVVNLDSEAQKWIERQEHLKFTRSNNPLRSPDVISEMVHSLHQKHQVDWSYGGYLENRSFLLAGSYLEASGNFLHLGVDISVPAGTTVHSCANAQVVVVDDDRDPNCGWGPRVILAAESEDHVSHFLIFGHLTDICVSPGDTIRQGHSIGAIGIPPSNGNWWPHLHLQAVDRTYYQGLSDPASEIDGYGSPAERKLLTKRYPDPLALSALIQPRI